MYHQCEQSANVISIFENNIISPEREAYDPAAIGAWQLRRRRGARELAEYSLAL